jgi:hypothetical protein
MVSKNTLRFQLSPLCLNDEIAHDISAALNSSQHDAERHQIAAVEQLEQRRRAALSKFDRGYEDLLEGRISEEFWTRKSAQWEAELAVMEAERRRVQAPKKRYLDYGCRNSRTRKTGRNPLQIAESGRTAPIARNRALELHLRSRKRLCHLC